MWGVSHGDFWDVALWASCVIFCQAGEGEKSIAWGAFCMVYIYIYIPPWNFLLGRWNLILQIWYPKWCHETRYIFHPAQHFWDLNMDVLLVDWIWHIWHCDSWRMTIWKDYLNFAWACINAWWKTVVWTFHTDQVLMRLFCVQICYAELDP